MQLVLIPDNMVQWLDDVRLTRLVMHAISADERWSRWKIMRLPSEMTEIHSTGHWNSEADDSVILKRIVAMSILIALDALHMTLYSWYVAEPISHSAGPGGRILVRELTRYSIRSGIWSNILFLWSLDHLSSYSVRNATELCLTHNTLTLTRRWAQHRFLEYLTCSAKFTITDQFQNQLCIHRQLKYIDTWNSTTRQRVHIGRSKFLLPSGDMAICWSTNSPFKLSLILLLFFPNVIWDDSW